MKALRGGFRLYPRAGIPLFLLVVLCLSTPSPAWSEGYPPDANDLLKRAKEEGLYRDRYWEVLLHYMPSGGGLESLIDDPHFFLATDGKTNPEAEIEATIKAFFESDKVGDEHPRCRFIARYTWLKEKLHIDESTLPEATCPEWNKTIEVLQPQSTALVFPAFFMNNPASMFGHTLIRIDGSYQSKLLSYATNYAAYTDAMGLLYPFKGVFGFYKGYFSLFPYYEMVKKYSNAEQRDMWEYKLNLSEEEVQKMLMHLWELKDIYSAYYFFDENCSYNLLFLLEIARPSLHLTDTDGFWVIPVDTIRAVRDAGIVDHLEYRPSRATRIRYIASLLDTHSQDTALDIVSQRSDLNSLDAFENQERRKILDLAIETIQYRYGKEEISKDDYLKLFLVTLRERSKSGPVDDPYSIPVPIPPHEGHPSSRVSLSMGINKDRPFQEIQYRPAYHALEDPDGGYLEGSQIVFANTALRYYDDGRMRLEDFDLIDIVSLSPRDRFFKPLSFKIETGLTRKISPETGKHLVFRLNPGIGYAFKHERMGLYYGLAEADLNIGSGYPDHYNLAWGMQTGVIKNMNHIWKVHLTGEILVYEIRERFQETHVSVVQSFRINRNNSVGVSILWEKVSESNQSVAKAGWNYYF